MLLHATGAAIRVYCPVEPRDLVVGTLSHSSPGNPILQPSHSRPVRALKRRAAQYPARSSSLPFT